MPPDEEGHERPAPYTSGLAVAGLLLGIVSLCVSVLAPLALVLSGVGFVRAGSRGGAGRSEAVGGLVAGALGLVFVPVMNTVWPDWWDGRRDRVRAQHVSNFRQVAIGVAGHDWSAKSLPPLVVPDPRAPAGAAPPDPSTRLGWRVAILPEIEHDPTYKQLDFSQAWDGPTNAPFTAQRIWDYQDLADPSSNQTRIRAFTGPGTLFGTGGRLATVPDGAANTILFVETTQTVPWAQNNELPFGPGVPLPPLGHPRRRWFLVAFADGSVRTVDKGVDPAAVRAAITAAGGEPSAALE